MRRLILAIFAMFGLATAAAACPDYNQYGYRYQASGHQLRTPRLFDVTAGGDSYIWDCPIVRPRSDRGAGYFPTPPDFSFKLSRMGSYQLVISVRSNCDAALLINTGSANWYYDDDDNGNQDPRIVLTRPSNGWMDVWIGTYDGNYCDAQLRMETFLR